jgi:uncharacterized membrane protein YgaE (UPF0421/DUF939 family)
MEDTSVDSPTPQNPITNWWQQVHFGDPGIDSFQTALAAALCLWLGHLLGLEHTYWAAISAIVVMGSGASVTFASCLDRILGSAVGALFGWATGYAWHAHVLVYGLSVAVCVLICSALRFHKAGHLAAVALTVVVLANPDSSPGHAALGRFCEVGLGVVVALAVTLMVSPPETMKTAIRRRVTNQR